ncbi:hypothetical protein ASG87_04305 [Frateuria sp. Soil773]|nr:hypothetical protein ASG87_04305 [Frateuria sp. Soil773]
MMAVLIFSIGLIGLAGLLVMATRSNHAAYLRTQVTFLASGMADRMRANPVGVWNNNYNSDKYPVSGSTAANADCSAGCNPAELAVADQRQWSSQLSSFLPGAVASISCDASAAGYTPGPWSLGTPASGATAATPAAPGQVGMRPPYGGNCKMQIKWSERKEGDKSNRDAELQTFAWEFQP